MSGIRVTAGIFMLTEVFGFQSIVCLFVFVDLNPAMRIFRRVQLLFTYRLPLVKIIMMPAYEIQMNF